MNHHSAAPLILEWIKSSDVWTVCLAGAVSVHAGGSRLCARVVRFIATGLTLVLYRLRVVGSHHLPASGGGLLVCNHVSVLDVLFVIAAARRPVWFLVDREACGKWWVRPFVRLLQMIPVDSKWPASAKDDQDHCRGLLSSGELLCHFAEGQITRLGQLLPFPFGVPPFMKDLTAPIIPIHLEHTGEGMFGSAPGRRRFKLPTGVRTPITVSFGLPLPAAASSFQVRQAVAALGAEAWLHRKQDMRPVHRSFIRTARRHPFRFAMTDSTSPRIGFLAALIRTLVLARRLKPWWREDTMVGIMLPPSVGAACANLAAMLMGKVPVNLNYTLPEEAIVSCIRQCGITRVLTSAVFLKRLRLELPVPSLLLEEIAAGPGVMEKTAAMLMACFCPASVIESLVGASRRISMDDHATVIFSSGSTGDPKGVPLTHFNIASNVWQMDRVFDFQRDHRFIGVLPFFHSFGFTGTLAPMAILGVGVAFHFNPTDARTIGQLIEKHEVTFVMATPTFLQLYLRGCEPGQFGSVRFAMVGAEKLPERLANAFELKFGLRPMEAYGCTECSPAVAVNSNDFRSRGMLQIGGKRGTIGHPLPGMAVRIVDVDSSADLPPGAPGLMLLKGPNVMGGYLDNAARTAEALKDGWYATGDVAAMDEDGFVTITDRLSRFSKIGGEMVPHLKVEEMLHQLAGVTEQIFCVTGLPDAKKGEKLVVLHCLDEAGLDDLLKGLTTSELPNLWKPKRDQFVPVPHIPLLGSGKTDLRKVKEAAVAAMAKQAGAE